MKITSVEEVLNKKEIKVCGSCHGGGKVPDMSWGSGVSDMRGCGVCNETGRVIEARLTVIADMPFNFKI